MDPIIPGIGELDPFGSYGSFSSYDSFDSPQAPTGQQGAGDMQQAIDTMLQLMQLELLSRLMGDGSASSESFSATPQAEEVGRALDEVSLKVHFA